MRITSDEQVSLSYIADRWWNGPDDGEEVTVQLRFRRPTHRSDDETLDLFMAFLDPLSGGYPYRTSIVRPGEEA
jgi:hypothetical protein